MDLGKSMNVFRESNYKNIIKSIMVQQGITLKSLSESVGVQAPYLSRVLRHDDHINREQLFLMSQHLDIQEDVFEYLALLLEYLNVA